MPLDIRGATENLIRQGWSDRDIDTVLGSIRTEEENLIRQGKTDQEIDSSLSLTKVKDRSGNDIQLFPQQLQPHTQHPLEEANPPTPYMKKDTGPYGELLGGTGAMIKAPPNVLQRMIGEFVQAYTRLGEKAWKGEPITAEDRMQAFAQGFSAPYSAVQQSTAAEAQSLGATPQQAEVIGDIPVAAAQAFAPITGAIRRGATKGFSEALKKSFPSEEARFAAAKNVTGEAAQTGRELVPVGAIKTADQGLGLPKRPITETLPVKATSLLPESQSSIVGQAGTPTENVGKIEETKPIIPTTEQIIDTSHRAMKLAEATGDIKLYKTATDTINQFGEVKPIEVMGQKELPFPEQIAEANQTAANLNKILNDKPEADLTRLAGTAVVDENGVPLKLYHGSPVGFKKLDVKKASTAAYNPRGESAIFATTDPSIAGGTYEPKFRGDVGFVQDLGYATYRNPTTPEHYETRISNYEFDINRERQYVKNPSATETEVDKRMRAAGLAELEKALKQTKEEYKQRLAEAPTVHQIYMNIKNPFNWDAPVTDIGLKQYVLDRIREGVNKLQGEGAWEKIPYRKSIDDYYNLKTNGNLLDVLDNLLPEGTGPYSVLKQFGYDGITYQGGKNTGGKPHQVYIAFDNKQIISVFDKGLYKEQLLHLANGDQLMPDGTYKPQPTVTERQAINNPDLVETEPGASAEIGTALVKRAIETGYTPGPNINDLDFRDISNRVFGEQNLNLEALIHSEGNGGRGVPPIDRVPLELPPPAANDPNILRGLPWYGKGQGTLHVLANLEAESKIPFLTQMHNKGQMADAGYIRMADKLQTEIKDTIREVGAYDRNTKKNIEIRERVSDALERISNHDKAAGKVSYQTANGRAIQGTYEQAARAFGESNVDVIKLAGRARDLYDKYWEAGSTRHAVHPNAHLDFYNPKRMTQQQRFEYVKGLRQEELGFFQYPRSDMMYPTERDFLKLLNRYATEWARIEHLMPWQKYVAEPIMELAIEAYKNSPRKEVTLNIVGMYILNKMRMPTKNSMDANTAMYDWVNNWLRPTRLGGNAMADFMIRKFNSDDRLADGISYGINNVFINLFQKYRPVPALRNAMQREFLIPFLPNGNIDLIKGQYRMLRNIDGAHDKFLASGLMGFIQPEHLGTKWDPFTMAEIGNMSTGFIIIHDGMLEDWANNMSRADWNKKWNIHLYPKALRDLVDEGWRDGNFGDIRGASFNRNQRQIGTTAVSPYIRVDENGTAMPVIRSGPYTVNAMLARYATMMTQFPKGPGETPYYARTGPVAKATWLFSTWTPMAIDYFANLSYEAAKGPQPGKDFFRIGKIFAYLYLADRIWEGITGKSLGSNPITNLPTGPVAAVGPGLALDAIEVLTGKWNAWIQSMISDDKKSINWNKFVSDRALKELLRTQPGLARDIRNALPFGPEERKAIGSRGTERGGRTGRESGRKSIGQ